MGTFDYSTLSEYSRKLLGVLEPEVEEECPEDGPEVEEECCEPECCDKVEAEECCDDEKECCDDDKEKECCEGDEEVTPLVDV